MIKEIVKDTFFLKQQSVECQKEDLFLAKDLKDTLSFHQNHCVGLAANMIGSSKRILIAKENKLTYILINPVYLEKKEPYLTVEGCLSLEGTREVKRYRKIKVQYLDSAFKLKIKTFDGFLAEIIEHEMDHFEGILI